MSVENSIRLVKKVHPENIVMVKIGNFYHVYGKDAYIFSYVFNYKIKITTKNCKTCGFPVSSLNKILYELEEMHINYMLLDRSENYEVTEKQEFKDNTYDETYNKAIIVINIKSRVQRINDYLTENMNSKDFMTKLKLIEEIIYEN